MTNRFKTRLAYTRAVQNASIKHSVPGEHRTGTQGLQPLFLWCLPQLLCPVLQLPALLLLLLRRAFAGLVFGGYG